MKIPFNRDYLTGKEILYIEEALKSGKNSTNYKFTHKCQSFFKHGFKRALLTTSFTKALEICAILANIHLGNEIIIPRGKN